MTDQPRTPTDLVLDALVYAPLGLALEVGELLPRLAERGRARYGTQVTTARMLGRLAVEQGCRELERRRQAGRASAPEPVTDDVAPAAGPPAGDEAAPAPDAAAGAAAAHTPPVDLGATVAAEAPAPVPAPADVARPGPAANELGIPDYDSLAASQVVPRLAGLRPDELDAVRRYEAGHRGRRTILARVAQLQAAS